MTAAAILAGGRATRLDGALKPLLVVGGARIIDRQLAILRPLFDEIIIVTNDPAPFALLGVPLVPDRQPDQGPLAGIDAALAHFAARQPSAVLCVAGDMPFLQPEILRCLRDAPPALAVVPRVANRPDPLCARYGPGFASHVTAALSEGRLALHALLANLPVTYLEEPELRQLDRTLRTFTNINTHDQLATANGR